MLNFVNYILGRIVVTVMLNACCTNGLILTNVDLILTLDVQHKYVFNMKSKCEAKLAGSALKGV